MTTLTPPAPVVARPRPRSAAPRRAVVALSVAGAALALGTAVPLLGPLLVALVVGVVAANTPRVAPHVVGAAPGLDRLLLRAGVVLLGLKVSVSDVVALGPAGLVVVLGTVSATYAGTQLLGRRLGVDREVTTLVAAGFSICGAAAVAAVETSLRARAQDVALAVALVTVFGTVMIAAVPTLGGVLGLTAQQSAVWAGASIHEVAGVIAAASLVGGTSVLATATAVKLARVALLAPVQLVSARVCRRPGERRGPLVPLFLVGFVGAVALRSAGAVPAAALPAAGSLTTLLLGAAMFGLGTSIVARRLWPVPGRVLLLATCSTLLAAGVSLGLVALLV